MSLCLRSFMALNEIVHERFRDAHDGLVGKVCYISEFGSMEREGGTLLGPASWALTLAAVARRPRKSSSQNFGGEKGKHVLTNSRNFSSCL